MIKRPFRYLKPQLLVMLVLFAGAAAAGALLLPGDAERVAMLERDGSYERALRLLEQRYAAGDRSQRTLYKLEHLHAHFGNLPKARAVLEQLAAARPNDLVLQRRLVKFYRDTQDTDAYLSSLSRLASRRYSEPICRELVAGLRLIGQYAREREAIERCRLKGYRNIDDIVRLAELEAASGDTRQASLLLRKVDDIGRLKGDVARMTLAALLVESGQQREARERAAVWIGSGSTPGYDERFGTALVAMLAGRRAYDTAIDIASKASRPGDGMSLQIARLLLNQQQTNAARAHLREWFEHANSGDTRTMRHAIEIALDAEDAGLAFTLAERTGFARLRQTDLAAVAEALAAAGRREEFAILRTEVAAETIAAHPLLAAVVEFERGETQRGRELLDSVSADALDEWRLALWARLMRDNGEGEAADAKLRSFGVATASLPTLEGQRTRRTTRQILSRRMKLDVAVKIGQAAKPSSRKLHSAKHRLAGKPGLARIAQIKKVKARAKATTAAKAGQKSKHHSGVGRPSPVPRPSFAAINEM